MTLHRSQWSRPLPRKRKAKWLYKQVVQVPEKEEKLKAKEKTTFSFFSREIQWHPTPVLLPGKSHGWRSLVCSSPWGRKESDTTERPHCHFSLSCIGEGNGNSFQCSCLENPRDGGAWWAAVYGVAQSRTRLKRLSSSSSSREIQIEPGSPALVGRFFKFWATWDAPFNIILN